jgi:hypothetical protein
MGSTTPASLVLPLLAAVPEELADAGQHVREPDDRDTGTQDIG